MATVIWSGGEVDTANMYSELVGSENDGNPNKAIGSVKQLIKIPSGVKLARYCTELFHLQ